MRFLWTPRELEIVEALTRKVRLLSVRHVAQIWCPSGADERSAARLLHRLVQGGLIDLTQINAHPPLQQQTPLFSWHPGDKEPDFERLATEAQSRWQSPATSQRVCSATKLAANLFGSTAAGLPPLAHRDHDLLLGQAYVINRLRRPQEAQSWVGEHVLPKAGFRTKDPDAFLIDAGGEVTRVIESAGRYNCQQVESFHLSCEEHCWPYELW